MIKKQRIVELDLIRCTAILFVVVTHSRTTFFSPEINRGPFIFYEMIGVLGVPLFVMLTGYLMLDRSYKNTEQVNAYVSRSLLPLLAAFEIWNVLWFLLDKVPVLHFSAGGFPLSLTRIIKIALFMGDTNSAMWYMPMMIALYLGIPIIANVLQSFSEKNCKYIRILMAAGLFFGTVVPSISDFANALGHSLDIHSVLNINIFGASVWGNSVWVVYLVLGYGIKQRWFDRIPSACILAGIGLSAVIYCIFDYRTIVKGAATISRYSNAVVVLLAAGIFIMLTRSNKVAVKLPKQMIRVFDTVSRYSFSIYMLHLFMMNILVNVFIRRYSPPIGDSFNSILHNLVYFVFVAAAMILAMITAWCLSRIPGAKKWVLLLK